MKIEILEEDKEEKVEKEPFFDEDSNPFMLKISIIEQIHNFLYKENLFDLLTKEYKDNLIIVIDDRFYIGYANNNISFENLGYNENTMKDIKQIIINVNNKKKVPISLEIYNGFYKEEKIMNKFELPENKSFFLYLNNDCNLTKIEDFFEKYENEFVILK